MEGDSITFGCLIFKILAGFHLEMPIHLETLILTSSVVLRRKVTGCSLSVHTAFPKVL